MVKKPEVVSPVILLIVAFGALAVLFSPEAWVVVASLALGIALEAIGIALRHRGPP